LIHSVFLLSSPMIKAKNISVGSHLILKSGSKVVITDIFPNKKEETVIFFYRYQTKGSNQIGDLNHMHNPVSFNEEFKNQ
jgi:hypothetical protein